MANLNKCIISGNLTRDAELRTTTGGTSVLTFTVAVTERAKDNSETVSFLDCVMFKRDGLKPYLTKGRKIGVTGRLRQSRWEREGQHRSKVEIIADAVEFFDSGVAQQRDHQAEPLPAQTVELYDQDIPF